MPYAAKTTVSTDRSLAQIRKVLALAGAEQFAFMEQGPVVAISFVLHDRRIRYTVPLPQIEDYDETPQRRFRRTVTQKRALYQRATGARWRSIVLLIKAKLEAVELGVLGFEEAFLAETVLPNGDTVAEWALPSIRRALCAGETPRLLGAAS